MKKLFVTAAIAASAVVGLSAENKASISAFLLSF